MSDLLEFRLYDHVIVDGTEYVVTGGIDFCTRSDGSRWMEYCIREARGNQVRWLSIDNMYEEYAIYMQYPYGDDFSEQAVFRNGFHDADSGKAQVQGVFGKVDAEVGDIVDYQEYEDGTEEQIIAVERWEDEAEYSRGYYLDREEIILLQRNMQAGVYGGDGAYGNGSNMGAGIQSGTARSGIGKFIVFGIIGIFILVTAVISAAAQGKAIAKFLKKDSMFTYVTSITSDLNNKEKADVYAASDGMTVDEAARRIIDGIEGKTEDVQQNDEDDSVAILTKKEYCLVYTGTEGETMVQISSRAYVYGSTNTPYHATSRTHSYYRRFYYSRGYHSDYSRYRRKVNGYENYDGGSVADNTYDTYQNYSDSVRQSSINSRSSSGGGTRSGK